MDYDFDCVVVGGGVAGLGAASVLGRARRRTLVLDRGGQSNRVAAHVGGLLGHDGVPPGELYELARTQVAAYDTVALRDADAVDARVEGSGFVVVLGDDGGDVRARSLVLATGMDYEVPDVRGFAELGEVLLVLPRGGADRPSCPGSRSPIVWPTSGTDTSSPSADAARSERLGRHGRRLPGR